MSAGKTRKTGTNHQPHYTMKVRTEIVTPILKDRILGEYDLARGNGMNKKTAIANVLITVAVTHEKIMEVLAEAEVI